ncbi:DUF2523 family protein [Citrobacter meridianamericanus]|uniref:DUF2523 family protein n=1 Tax=Citrobacter meridianamericanus TaxID=2894201 RepID=UPI00351D257C
MYRILVSAINYLLGWVLKQATMKAIIFGALTFLISEIMGVVTKLLPDSTNLVSLFDQLPDSAWYFINLAQLPFGLSVVFSALVTRFIIGMIPIVGK